MNIAHRDAGYDGGFGGRQYIDLCVHIDLCLRLYKIFRRLGSIICCDLPTAPKRPTQTDCAVRLQAYCVENLDEVPRKKSLSSLFVRFSTLRQHPEVLA